MPSRTSARTSPSPSQSFSRSSSDSTTRTTTTTYQISNSLSVRNVRTHSPGMSRGQKKPEIDEPQRTTRPTSSGSRKPTPANRSQPHPGPAQEGVKEKDQGPHIVEVVPEQPRTQETQHGRQPRESSPYYEPTPVPGKRYDSNQASYRTPHVSQDRTTVRGQGNQDILEGRPKSSPRGEVGRVYRAQPEVVQHGHEEISQSANRAIGRSQKEVPSYARWILRHL